MYFGVSLSEHRIHEVQEAIFLYMYGFGYILYPVTMLLLSKIYTIMHFLETCSAI